MVDPRPCLVCDGRSDQPDIESGLQVGKHRLRTRQNTRRKQASRGGTSGTFLTNGKMPSYRATPPPPTHTRRKGHTNISQHAVFVFGDCASLGTGDKAVWAQHAPSPMPSSTVVGSGDCRALWYPKEQIFRVRQQSRRQVSCDSTYKRRQKK